MVTGFLLGAITMLAGVIVGYVLAKPWLDKRLNRKPVQPQQQQGVTTP